MLTRRGLLVGAAAGALVACGPERGTALERARRSGVIRVGISDEQPYSYLDDSGRLAGEAPAVAAAVLSRVGVSDLEAVQRPFAQLVSALLAGQFDIITAGMAITPDRCARVAFSAPDFVAPTAFLLERGNPLRLRTFADVARARVPVAVLAGAVEEHQARAAAIPPDRLVSCPGQSQLWDAVDQGRARVGALTDISLRRLLARHPGSTLQVSPGGVRTAAGGPVYSVAGFAFRPADTDLRQAFDTGLLAVQASGEWLRVASAYGVAESNRPPPGVRTAGLCSPA